MCRNICSWKIENWSEIVKQQWDKDTRENINIKVILLGSSPIIDSERTHRVIGRTFRNILSRPLSFAEMKAAFEWSIEQYVYFGGYPGAASLITDEERWKNYMKDALIETSISKDILMLTRVDKPALLKRLFELGCLYSGQILSFTKILASYKMPVTRRRWQIILNCCLTAASWVVWRNMQEM